MVTFRKTNKFADRGKSAEEAVQKYLKKWQDENPHREFSRLADSKSAGRTIKQAAADFEFYSATRVVEFGLIEVKSTEHKYRLGRDKLTQLPRLRKRTKCGGLCLVLVYHSELGKWRVARAEILATSGDKGSWDLSLYQLFDSPGEALAAEARATFT